MKLPQKQVLEPKRAVLVLSTIVHHPTPALKKLKFSGDGLSTTKLDCLYFVYILLYVFAIDFFTCFALVHILKFI